MTSVLSVQFLLAGIDQDDWELTQKSARVLDYARDRERNLPKRLQMAVAGTPIHVAALMKCKKPFPIGRAHVLLAVININCD
jgi:hypothetical protein